VSLRAAYECLAADPDTATPQTLATLEDAGVAARRCMARSGGRPHLAGRGQHLGIDLRSRDHHPRRPCADQTLRRLIDKTEPLPMSVGSRPDRRWPRLTPGAVGRNIVALGAAAMPIFDEINPRFDVLLKR